jgi:hypothetical protein
MANSVSLNGHSCTGDTIGTHTFPPTNSTIPAQDLLFVDGVEANVVGHGWPPHICISHPHVPPLVHSGRTTSGGSPLTTVDGKALGRVGDPISCTSVIAQGSELVFSD